MIKDSFWTDSYISNLDPIEKLLFVYLLTNPLCNIAGIYEIQLRRIAFDTGIDKDMLEKLISRLVEDGKLLVIDDWVVIINHAKHQSYKNPNVSKGIQRIIEELPEKVKALKGFERLTHLTLLNLTLPNTTDESVDTKPTRRKKGTGSLVGEFQNITLTEEETEKLNIRYGIVQTSEIIEELSAFIESSGKEYKSHYAALLNWAKRNKLQEASEHDEAVQKAIDWLVTHQGRNSERVNKPKQREALLKLINMGVLPNEVKRVLIEIESEEYWREREEKPDFLTVAYKIQKRG